MLQLSVSQLASCKFRRELLLFCLPFTKDLLNCGMTLHHNILSFWLVTQVPGITYNFIILYGINYLVVAQPFATTSCVLASYLSVAKTIHQSLQVFLKISKVVLMEYRMKKGLTDYWIPSFFIEQVHWLLFQ
jgi:hypothetical protein